MKATEIKMQIVKNIGNFQSVRLEATYSLDSTSPSEIEECFKKARFDLEKSFISIYSKNEIKEGVNDIEEVSEKPEPNKQQFQRILKAYRAGNITIEEIESEFMLSDELRGEIKQII
jgi:hypothetical protein